jgi:hypothetical protein
VRRRQSSRHIRVPAGKPQSLCCGAAAASMARQQQSYHFPSIIVAPCEHSAVISSACAALAGCPASNHPATHVMFRIHVI